MSAAAAIRFGGHLIEEEIDRERPDMMLKIQAERCVFALASAGPIVSAFTGAGLPAEGDTR